MERMIDINSETCTKCGKCVKVCPSKIFTQEASDASISMVNVQGCIVCGHCVAACPTDSVEHADFSPEKVHAIDYSKMPTPEQMMLLYKARRSNRAFTKKPVPSDMLDMILDAAHRAPTASNQQQVQFTLVTDPQMISRITDFTLGVFGSLVRKLENPLLKPLLKIMLPGVYAYLPTFHRLIEERAKGTDLILRGATAVIFIHTPNESRFGCQDANMAYQNGSLMAESLGVSQFYTGFVCTAAMQDKGNELAKMLGIKGKIHAGMALGMPSFRFPKYIDRKDIIVNKI